MSDPLDMAPELVPFVTGEELERRQREIDDHLAFLREVEEPKLRERHRLERPKR